MTYQHKFAHTNVVSWKRKKTFCDPKIYLWENFVCMKKHHHHDSNENNINIIVHDWDKNDEDNDDDNSVIITIYQEKCYYDVHE